MLCRFPSLALLSVLLFGAAQLTAAAPPEVEQLIKQLSDKDETVRLKAAKELGKLKEKAKDAIPALTAATADADEDVRSVAKRSLAAIKEAVGDNDSAKIRAKLAPMIKDLQAKDIKVRLAAIAQLEEIGTEAKEAGGALVEFGMMSPSPKVREAANSAFEKIDPLVYKEVLTLFIDERAANKTAAVETLRRMGSKAKASVPAIKGYHEHLVKTERVTPAYTVRALVAIAPEDAGVQRLVLNLVGGSDDALPRSFGREDDRAMVIAEMHNLKIDNKQKYGALMAGLSASMRHRAIIIKELGKLGSDAKAALPALKALKTDKEQAVREAANTAIEAIQD
jgi:HEAT repeat protein